MNITCVTDVSQYVSAAEWQKIGWAGAEWRAGVTKTGLSGPLTCSEDREKHVLASREYVLFSVFSMSFSRHYTAPATFTEPQTCRWNAHWRVEIPTFSCDTVFYHWHNHYVLLAN